MSLGRKKWLNQINFQHLRSHAAAGEDTSDSMLKDGVPGMAERRPNHTTTVVAEPGCPNCEPIRDVLRHAHDKLNQARFIMNEYIQSGEDAKEQSSHVIGGYGAAVELAEELGEDFYALPDAAFPKHHRLLYPKVIPPAPDTHRPRTYVCNRPGVSLPSITGSVIPSTGRAAATAAAMEPVDVSMGDNVPTKIQVRDSDHSSDTTTSVPEGFTDPEWSDSQDGSDQVDIDMPFNDSAVDQSIGLPLGCADTVLQGPSEMEEVHVTNSITSGEEKREASTASIARPEADE